MPKRRRENPQARAAKQTAAAHALATMASHTWHATASHVLFICNELREIANGSTAGIPTPRSAIGHNSATRSKAQRVGDVLVVPVLGCLEPEPGIYSDWFGGTACSQIRSDIRAGVADGSIKEIALLVDSPGGIAAGVDETAAVIEQARKTKTVTAYCQNVVASAGYYLAAGAGRIVATSSTAVGSVGSIIGHMSYAGMLRQMGLEYTPIQFGENKQEGNPYQKLTPKAHAGLQQMVDAYGKQFVEFVARGRRVSLKAVTEGFGQGRVFIAQDALHRGMIDGIEILEDRFVPEDQRLYRGRPVSQVLAEQIQPDAHRKLAALLFALGMTTTPTAARPVVDAAMLAFCHARGIQPPMAAGTIDPSACLRLLQT